MRYLLTLFLIAFSYSLLNAQNTETAVSTPAVYTIKGKYIDDNQQPVLAADVNLLVDSNGQEQVLASIFTEVDGSFLLESLNPGKYIVEFKHDQFQPIRTLVELTNQNVDLGNIRVGLEVQNLTDVVIQGHVVGVMQKGDTSEYNANAYKTNPDATTEDLIRKMPGVDLSEGTPKAQGENIGKVLVDGKPFFGDDVNATLRNLPAEVVQSIQIYDEKSETSQQTGFDDGNTIKTLNIVTREDKRQGIFGKVYAGYGNPDYWNVGGSVNYFKGNERITLLGQTNNINIQNFSSEDLGGGSQGGGRGGRGGGGSQGGGRSGGNNDFAVNQRNGITTTNAIGLNYSNVWKDKVKFTGSYFFNNSRNVAMEEIDREYLTRTLAGQQYRESNSSQNTETSHRFNFRLEYQIDSSNYLMISPSLRIQNGESFSNMRSSTFFEESAPLSATENSLTSISNSFNFSNRLLYSHKFAKPGRTITLFNNTSINKRSGDNTMRATYDFADTMNNYELDQIANSNSNGWNTATNLNYTEPLTQKLRLQLTAGMNLQNSSSDKKTYNYNNILGEYADLDTRLSNEFQSTYTTYSGGAALGYTDSLINFIAGANAQKANLENDRILPVVNTLKYDFTNVLPYASLTYNLARRKSLRLNYRTNTNTPSVNQLQDVLDNSNTLIFRTGNPLLRQNYDHRLFANYRTSNSATNTNFFIMVMGQLTQDFLANSTTIAREEMIIDGITLQPGMQYVKPVNLDGYYRVFSHSSYGMPLKFIKSNLNLNANIGQTRTPGMTNNEINYATNNTVGFGLTLSSNISENIDFTIGTRANYSNVKNSLNTNADNKFWNQNSRFDLNYLFAKRFFFNTQLNHQYYSGISDDFNQSFLLWNMAVGAKLFKKNQAEIKLSVFDLLNQNQAISRTFTDNYTQDTYTNVLQQYFMLTFTYNIRNFKGKSSEADMRSSQERGPGGPGAPGGMHHPPTGR